MIKVEVTYAHSVDKVKEQQIARAIERTVKYLVETEFIDWVTTVKAEVVSVP